MRLFAGILAVLTMSSLMAMAQEMTVIAPSGDNTLFEDPLGSVSNGAGPSMFVGRNNQGALRRGVIAFDVAGSIPAGASIDSASLALFMDQTTSGAHVISLHRATSEWGEGTSSSGGGTGAPSTTGDATWIHTFYDSDFWTSAGGDFAMLPSVSLSVDDVGTYHFRSAALAADVQGWLDNPAENYGWVLVGDEAVNQTAKRFATKEHATAANRPVLTVYWSGAVSVQGADGGQPYSFVLSANYPNPFNPGTTIRYSIAERSHVTITIFTVTGREVIRLVDKVQQPGVFTVVWDATGMATGPYLYSIQAGAFNDTRRMILMK
ncbi:MAG: DNRLRE domain-containing protein [Ignavibacteria bacterium]|nr:DNRLRE domain-containing protein [Ignavibacteria bacterium]